MGFDDSAHYYFAKAAAADSRAPELYYNLGVIQMAKGQADSAFADFFACLSIDPGYSAAKYRLGQLYESTGDTAMAMAYYDDFVKTAPIIYLEDINQAKGKLDRYRRSK